MREAVAMAARPTMISAKYRLKEERRRMLKLSVNKLRRIEDPESALCRSVLINNTVRRLQREQREARNPVSVSVVATDLTTSSLFADPAPSPAPVPALLPTTLPTPLRDEETPVATPLPVPEAASPNLVLEELEDVLSQFYMPPTPRMITSIDEDDDDEGRRRPSKRLRLADADEEGAGRALADPTNTLEDFRDEVYLRSRPRVPLTSAACANACEDALRAEYCRRYTHTGHDRENIAPFGLAQGLAQGLVGLAAGLGAPDSQAAPHAAQPYSCSQAHGQAQQAGHLVGHGLGFHGLMATMES